ncbi:MAG: hypothetical protein ACTHMM_21140 [Agriterribacter sp.]
MNKNNYIVKDTFFKFLDDIGIVWQYTISGVLGATAWAIHKRKNLAEALRNIFAGGICAAYCTPIMIKHIPINEAFAGFLVGVGGMSVVEYLFNSFIANKTKISDAIKAALKIINK